MKGRMLITGGAGFIGSHLTDWAGGLKAEARAADRRRRVMAAAQDVRSQAHPWLHTILRVEHEQGGNEMANLEERIQKIFHRPQVAALATTTEDGKPWVRYVAPFGDHDFTLRFASFLDSRKVEQIRRNPEVHMTCGISSPDSREDYLQVQGRARVLTGAGERRSFWKEEFKEYFSGPDDPNYCLVEVKPYRIEYVSSDTHETEVWMG
ncbi:MAG: pyridoxamine 5'-phosphate oxidase family protein [bacterium]